MNAQETSFYNSVTGFSPAGIKKALKKQDTATTKFWTIKAEVGKELMKARDYYNSEEGKTEMDDAGICYNDICDFFQVLTEGQMKKPSVYKRIKVYENIDTAVQRNEDLPKLFVTAVKQAKEQDSNVKIVQSDEGFNYFCANGELKIKGATATASESEAEEPLESEGEDGANESEDDTKYSFAMTNTGDGGACIRLDVEGNVLAEDGGIFEITIAMTNYLKSKGFSVTQND